ncbi:MAG: UvrD/REP helicase [Candidatus Magasanikbacteria bacterium GW2011_GWC2_34_16]|uniref:DNA 3'-5' helicase n=2 Tax=Candidatus Magasanikiibacteriota TaxID=1752731 RepID=A0A0G0DVV2_9BACT|nr:MAG: UvrD/REP helicase [Candidatus Magasanikbacteria bacterium GW2011_GWC2_34_16]
MPNWEKELNSEQLDVVLHGDGPCLVLAGAGSGKTRTITYRVAYLLEKGVSPENILLVTFTNKAAAEMTDRIQKLTGIEKSLPWAGTFHHIGHKMLRQHAITLGYQNNFSILDSDDSESLIKLAAKDYSTNKGDKKFPSAKVLQGILSYARNCEMAIPEVLEIRYSQFAIWSDAIIEIAREYAVKKQEANAMDFDDLLVNALKLLNDPKILKKYSEQFQYILADEYQDTNKIQSAFVRVLASAHNNIIVVGDDAQSIYSFRGADIANILQFEKDFPKAKIFRLETNYRSSHEIISVANAVIANNPKQYKKVLKTILTTGVKPEIRPHGDPSEEARYLTEKISSLIRGGVTEKEIAVLFRASHHSQQLELELMRAGIDYDYRGGLRFFDRSHVKDVLAYLRLIANMADTTAWMRVLMFEDGIGPASAGKIIDLVKKVEALEELKEIEFILGEKAKVGWRNFLSTFNGLIDIGKNQPNQMIEHIVSSSYKNYLEAERPDADQRLQDLKQLANFAKKYDDLEQFLAEAALQEAFTLQRKKEKDSQAKDGRIVLSTIHQAKGLEWSAVFVINLTQGGFPNERALREDNGVEEERRLFYVAVTRAKKYLFLTYPMTNNRPSTNNYNSSSSWGDSMVSEPSMFLDEIDTKLINDHSFLKNNTAFNEELTYEREDKPLNIKPGSFLRSVDEL